VARRSLPRCTCVTKDGSTCGRRVSDGSNPPVCHIHRAHQQGRTVSPLTEPIDIDEEKILRRLMRDADPSIRLRAVTAWIEFKGKVEKECPRCEARRDDERLNSVLIAALVDEERTALTDALTSIRRIKEAVYAREPNARPLT
jgi:hypothetical protein